MKRIILVLAAALAAVFLIGGVALAATIDGTDGDDTLAGTGEADTIKGYGGDDTISGLAGDDLIQGRDGTDRLFGGDEKQSVTGGNDRMDGGNGADTVVGGLGADTFYGGEGGDTIYDGPDDDGAVDRVYGGDGDDTIVSANMPASRDVVGCGGDRDKVVIDGLDEVSANCEDVDRLLSAEETQRSMARGYASEYGVSTEEAARRLSLQDQAGELEVELEAREAATFGSLYIEHEPSFRVVALFTRGGEQTMQSHVAGTPLEGVVEVRQVDATLEELEAAQDEATSIYESKGVAFNSDIDVIQNRVEVYVTDETRERVRVQSTQLPEQVAEIPVNTLSTFEESMYGGRALSTCTSGFTVRYDGDTEGFLTAGHCRPHPNDGGQYFQGKLMPFQQQDFQGSQDVQWHTSPNIDDRAYFRAGSNILYPVRKIEGRSQQSRGRHVCKYGMSTGRTCGEIAGNDFDPGADFNATFIRVCKPRAHICTENLSSPGDSGSPWFDGRTALGVHSGATGEGARQAFYMPINYAQDTYLGIKVQRVR
jgi:hypothetical protein